MYEGSSRAFVLFWVPNHSKHLCMEKDSIHLVFQMSLPSILNHAYTNIIDPIHSYVSCRSINGTYIKFKLSHVFDTSIAVYQIDVDSVYCYTDPVMKCGNQSRHIWLAKVNGRMGNSRCDHDWHQEDYSIVWRSFLCWVGQLTFTWLSWLMVGLWAFKHGKSTDTLYVEEENIYVIVRVLLSAQIVLKQVSSYY